MVIKYIDFSRIMQQKLNQINCFANFKILILLLLINTAIEQRFRLLYIFYTEIHLLIKGSGEQKILSDKFQETLNEVFVNGEQISQSKSYYLSETNNYINLTFNSLSSFTNMFSGLENIIEVNLSVIEENDLKYMMNTFYNCINLEKIVFGKVNMPQLTNLNSLFSGCSKLFSVNLANLEISRVTDMSRMFYQCKSIEELNLSNFILPQQIELYDMLQGCESLKYLNIYSFKYTYIYSINLDLLFNNISSNVVYCFGDENLKNYVYSKIILSNEITFNYEHNYCLESCKENKYQYKNLCYNSCPQGTLLDNYFCRDNTCNETVIDNEQCLNGEPRGYYYDSNEQIYKKCFYSCDSCYGDRSSPSHNCKICKENYRFLNESESIYENNCYEICNYYYFFDNNNYNCTHDKICPKEYSKLIISKNKCVEKCDNNDNNQNNNINSNDVTNFCYEF